MTETAAEEVAGEVPAGEAVRQEDAPRPRRARIRAAAEPVEAPQEEDAPEEVQVDFSDEDAALAAQSAGLELDEATAEEEAAERRGRRLRGRATWRRKVEGGVGGAFSGGCSRSGPCSRCAATWRR